MAGPYPPYPGDAVPYPTGPVPSGSYLPGYPGPLPPPVSYPAPGRRGRARRWVILGTLAVVAAVIAAALFIGGRPSGGSAGFTAAASQTAIQNYLTALSSADTETIARNGACGLFDDVKDKKSDLALARLASDAFRKQFSKAEVTSIDKIVLSSSYQANVLFTMKVARTSARSTREEEQGVAQLLRQDNQILVCSYLLRTSAQY